MFVCASAHSSVGSVEYRWLRGDVVVKEEAVGSGAFSTLDLPAVRVGDSGNYICQTTMLSATGVVIASLNSSSERLTIASELFIHG